jgi:hypothetical protein
MDDLLLTGLASAIFREPYDEVSKHDAFSTQKAYMPMLPISYVIEGA